ERGVLALPGLRVPDAVVFGLEKTLELLDAVLAVFLLRHALRAAEVIRKLDELRAIEMPVAAAIAVRRRDRRCAERAPVIAALEREHQAFSARGIAHDLERILDRLRAADVEVHAAVAAPLLLRILGDDLRQLDLG